MRIRVIKLGRIAYPEIRSLASMYTERLLPLARPMHIESHELKDDSGLERLLLRPASDHLLIALDERGQEWTSPQLASQLQKHCDNPAIKSLTFLIGGPLGLSPAHRQHAQLTWCLSKATLTSDMAWLLLWEQLYRAVNILKGTSYHHV